MDLNTKRHLRCRIRVDLTPYPEGGSMISVNLPEVAKDESMIKIDLESRSMILDHVLSCHVFGLKTFAEHPAFKPNTKKKYLC